MGWGRATPLRSTMPAATGCRRRARRHVTAAPGPPGRSPELATNLVEYFVVVLPDRAALGGVVPAVTEMVRSRRIRVLDLVGLARGGGGAVDVVEVGEAGDLAALQELEGDTGLLSENDLRLAASAVRQGEVGLVLVAAGRWAAQLSPAALARA